MSALPLFSVMKDKVIDLVRQGKMSLTKAAEILSVDVKTIDYWVKKKGLSAEEAQPITDRLQFLVDVLEQRLVELLSLPPGKAEMLILKQIDQIRKLLVDIVSIQEKIKERPRVEIKFQQIILSALCPKCKKKVLEALEDVKGYP